MNQIEVLRRALGGIYIAITGALDAETAAYANETLLALAQRCRGLAFPAI